MVNEDGRLTPEQGGSLEAMRVVLLLAILTGVLVGCSAKSSLPTTAPTTGSRMLHMRGMNISPADLRADARAYLLQQGGATFCQGLKGLSDDEVAATLHAAEANSNPTVLPPGATAVPGQTPFPVDARAAAQIIQDECARVAP